MFNTSQKAIIQYLASGKLISGTELAEAILQSRTAIWKNIKQIQSKGIPVQVFDKQGYQIHGGLDLYDENFLKDNLSDLPIDLSVLDTVASTNDCLQLESTAERWRVVLAEQQTAGRGRRGRVWASPYGNHIYLSMGFFHQGPLEQLQGLSLVIGLIVRSILAEVGLNDVQVKWPNDVWVEQKKIAGILVEIKGEANEGYQIILGLGLNVHREDSLNEFNAVAVDDYLGLDKTTLVLELIPKIMQGVQALIKNRFIYFKNDFNRHHVFHQKKVSVIGDPDLQQIDVVSVHDDGGLIVSKEGLQQTLYGSEISLC